MNALMHVGVLGVLAFPVWACGGRTTDVGGDDPDPAGTGGSSAGGGLALGGRIGSSGRPGAGGRGAGGRGAGGANPCDPIDCGSFTCLDPVWEANACCPTCDGRACEEGRTRYRELIDSLISAPDSQSCRADADCVTLPWWNACESTCFMLLNTDLAIKLEGLAKETADLECGSCTPPLPTPCPMSGPARCVAGYCAILLP